MFTITATMRHTDPIQVHLTISGEQIETTPEHPFFTQERGWVDAGDLWHGAHVRQASGGYSVVQSSWVEREPQVMYNLTVAEAHTFFVGTQQWLVHNASRCVVTYQPLAGFADDVIGKGFHVDTNLTDLKELSLLPRKLENGTIEILVKPSFSGSTGEVTNAVVKAVQKLLDTNSKKGIEAAKAIVTKLASDSRPSAAARVAEARLIIEALTRDAPYTLVR